MLIAQITDTHVDATPDQPYDAAGNLRRAIDYVNGHRPRPDLVLISGDLTNEGQPDDYTILKGILDRLEIPYFLIPGNHDLRAPMLAAFGGQPCLPVTKGPLQYTVEDYPLRFIAVDTLQEMHMAGHLDAEKLGWLRARLDEQPDRPTVIFMHHPPFRTHLPLFDSEPFIGAEGLAEILRGRDNIVRVVCGHLHRPVQTIWAGVPFSVCPSTAMQVAMSMDPEEPFILSEEPPAIQFHLWADDLLVTHTIPMPGEIVRPKQRAIMMVAE